MRLVDDSKHVRMQRQPIADRIKQTSGPVEHFHEPHIFCGDLSLNSFIQTLISSLNQPIVSLQSLSSLSFTKFTSLYTKPVVYIITIES